MNLENFRKDYLKIITESTDEDLKNYIRSVVKDTLAEGVQSKNYNVSEKHNISAGTYPRILKAVNTLSGKNNLSIKMSAKESDLDKMENALEKNPKDETVLSMLRSRLTEGVQSKNYNVSEKHTISAGTYPRILKAVNTLTKQNNLSIKMSAKESDLDKMENDLEKNPKDETVLSKLRSRLAEGVQSKNYNVSEKHNISAGNYPRILKAVNTLSGKNNLSIKMSAKESDLDKMENALENNPKDETVLSKLRSRLTEALDGGPYVDTYPGEIPLTLAALGIVTGYDPEEVNILDMIGSSEGFMDFNLDEIESALGALKGKINKEKYNDFIEGDEDDQDQILFDYKSKIDNLAQASEFLNWAVNT